MPFGDKKFTTVQRAAERSFLRMSPHVRPEISGLSETFIAYVALKWLFASVGSHVLIARAGSCKALIADMAREWTFTSMATFMVN